MENSKMMYGSRKISAALAKESIFLSRYQVGKVMKDAGITSLYKKKENLNHIQERDLLSKLEVILLIKNSIVGTRDKLFLVI